MTRAKDSLHLIVPQRFFTYGQSAHGDRHLYASRSRFLPTALLPLFELRAGRWSRRRRRPRRLAKVRLDIGARMRACGGRKERRDV